MGEQQKSSEERNRIPTHRPVERPDPGPITDDPGPDGPASTHDKTGARFRYESEPIADRTELDEERIQAVLDDVLSDDTVGKRLSDHRYEALGLVRQDAKRYDLEENQDPPLVLLVYDYTADVTLAVTVDSEDNGVMDVSERDRQVALTGREVERAVEILNESAANDVEIAPTDVKDAVVHSSGDQGHPRYGHRGVLLYFDPTGALSFVRSPSATHVAEIDLSAGDVLDVREAPDDSEKPAPRGEGDGAEAADE
jgi:hypothetical protein